MAKYNSKYTGRQIDDGLDKANTALQEHQQIKTLNNQSLVGEGNIDIQVPTTLSQLSDDSTHRVVTDTEKETWSGKQDELISGTSIKTINDTSLLGNGNIDINGVKIKRLDVDDYVNNRPPEADIIDVMTNDYDYIYIKNIADGDNVYSLAYSSVDGDYKEKTYIYIETPGPAFIQFTDYKGAYGYAEENRFFGNRVTANPTIYGSSQSLTTITIDTIDYRLPNGIPNLPNDASSKTYILKAINGVLTWIEEV